MDSSEKLAKVLSGTTTAPVNDNDRGVRGDFNCVLVQYPAAADVSEVEEDVLTYHKMTCDASPQPVIPLQVWTCPHVLLSDR